MKKVYVYKKTREGGGVAKRELDSQRERGRERERERERERGREGKRERV